MSLADERLARARTSLEGLSVGDSLGEAVMRAAIMGSDQLSTRLWPYTDDTNMAMSIFQILRQYGHIDQDALAASFAKYFDSRRGYGMGAIRLLIAIQEGGSWRDLAPAMFGGTGSYGNGAAMRVAPLGAYFADDIDAAVENARLSAEITHAHPEGIAGAIAVAVAAAYACQLRQTQETRPTRQQFIDRVIPHVPKSEVLYGIKRARELAPDTSLAQVVATLGNGSQISAQDTVPFVLWNAGEYLHDYATAVWQTAMGGGDADTTCAMVGGIVVCYTSVGNIPKERLARRELLPIWPFED